MKKLFPFSLSRTFALTIILTAQVNYSMKKDEEILPKDQSEKQLTEFEHFPDLLKELKGMIIKTALDQEYSRINLEHDTGIETLEKCFNYVEAFKKLSLTCKIANQFAREHFNAHKKILQEIEKKAFKKERQSSKK
jgi:hypothetical protein